MIYIGLAILNLITLFAEMVRLKVHQNVRGMSVPGRSERLISISMVLILILSSSSMASALFQGAGDGPMAGPRAVLIPRMSWAAPTIDGTWVNPTEWNNAKEIDTGVNANTVKLYIEADGVWLYVAVDVVSDTDQEMEGSATQLEYTSMIWDGNNDGKITYQPNAPGSAGVSYGGKNADFGIIAWGDGTFWNSAVTGAITYSVGQGGNSVIAAGFVTTPNSGTQHRFQEYKIPYDGPLDELGGTLGYSFAKGFNLFVREDNAGTGVGIGGWPQPLASQVNTFDVANLPQKYPHIVTVKSPKDGEVYQTGQNVKFEMTSTDNNLSTLKRTLYLNTKAYDMGALDVLNMNNIAPGEYSVNFTVLDDEGLSETVKAGKITISEAEVAPVIESFTPTQTSNTIDEGKDISFSVKWHDDNQDQKNESVLVSWIVDGKAAIDHRFDFNSTYHISNLTYTADYSSAGAHNIDFSLTDSYFGGLPPVGKSWTVTVNNVNRPPRIFNTDPETSSRVYITEAQAVTFTIEKTDPDNTPTPTQLLTVAWYLNGVEQTAAKNSNTYTFNDNPPKYDLAGNDLVKVVVSDGIAQDSVQWNITVSDVDRPPTFSTLDPSETDVTLKEGDTQTFSFTASDPDNNDLRYNWSINSVQKTSGNGSTGTFDLKTVFLPADGWDSSKCSPCFVSVNVTDGKLSVETEWKVVVTNVNRPPVVVIERPKEGDTFLVGEEVNFKTSASYDLDKDPLTYSWDFGDHKTDTKTDLNHIYSTANKYQVTLSASDGHVTVTRTVNITIVIPKLKLVDVTYTPVPAKEGQVINISVQLKNTGSADAHNVKIKFYIGSISGNPASESTVDTITAGNTATATTTWIADTAGSNTLWAVIDDSTAYQIDGNANKNVIIQVQAKPKPVVVNPLLSPLFLGAIILVVVLVIVVAFVLYKRKKEADAKEDAAVKAIMDAKTKPAVYQPRQAEASPYDRTDFKFGPGAVEPRPCIDCRKTTTNPSGLCNDCADARRAREHKRKMMSCPVCGNEVSKDMFTCPYCHFNFSKADKGEVEEAEKKHEAVGYVSDDACADCGVMFNDGMSVLKCPSCQARYHKRCSERLENCAECNADLSSGQSMVFKAPAASDTELAETVAIKPEEIAEEEARTAPKEEPKVEAKPEGPVCPKCGDSVEPGWKVCPSCDADLKPKAEVPPKPLAVEKPKEAPPIVDKIMEKVPAAVAGKCPKCGDEVEPDWKVCPSCDAPLGAKAPPPKPVAPPKPEIKVKPKEEPKKVEALPAVAGKCPKCGDEVEPDWKVCPSCDAVLRPAKAPEPKPEVKKEDDVGKKKIVWSKTAKDKALTKEPTAQKPEAKPEPKKPEKAPEEGLKEELDALAKEIEGLEKGGKDIKKAKSLATLASSFLKGKQPDKARIYIERARVELKKT